MFDTYQVGPRSVSHHHDTNITEKRAPTDESVRLLREMEKAAEDSILERGRSENNDLHYRWHILQNPGFDDLKLVAQFTLNGKDHRFDTRWSLTRFEKPEEKLKIIRDEVLGYLANQITYDLVKSHSRSLLPNQP